MRNLRTGVAAIVGAIAATSVLSGSAFAATDLEIDVNNVTVQARNSADTTNALFTTSFSGLLKLSLGSGYLNDVTTYDENGDVVDTGIGTLTGFSGVISLSNGVITGGNLSVAVNNGTSATYSLTSASSPDNAITSPAPYSVSGDTDGGSFTSNSFAGLSIPEFLAAAPMEGSIVISHYQPATSGLSLGKSTVSNVDLLVSVPEPASIGLITGSLAYLSFRRNRREVASK